MANKSGFDLELGVMKGRIDELDGKLHGALGIILQEVVDYGVTYAKTNAPWHDQTGNARAGLHGEASMSARQLQIVFAHGVSYGIWLEIAHSGHWQIIMPTVKIATDRMASHLKGLMGNLR